ncbi:SRPBCC family protein [Halorarius litoreus]|uniref:SRPBCC family protein n=1 Tax=Halorarius litoreus TaxID=2962676 RepID=UPI0020CFD730|nr:SRPBCC family protein [Halorarius litoreus]
MVRLARTPDGRRLEVSHPIDAPPERVWALFCDTEAWPEWGPSVSAVESPTRTIEAGTRGRVKTVGGLWLPFEVTSCENYRWTWDVAGLPATGHRVEKCGSGCRAVMEVPVVAAAYVPVCKRGLERLGSLAGRESEVL